MKFDTFRTLFEMSKELDYAVPLDEFYHILLDKCEAPTDDDTYMYQLRAAAECNWYAQKRPFYKVWPSVIPYLTKTRLDIKLTDIPAQNRTFAIFMPAGRGSALVTKTSQVLALVVLMPNGESGTTRLDACDRTIDQTIREHPVFTPFLRLAVAILLLENDPSIIEREVLNRDRLKWEEHRNSKYVKRAIQRGVNGWRIGEKLEVIPHIRRPHFAIRHTRNGPVLRPIKGSIVHREAVEKVPTGRLDF